MFKIVDILIPKNEETFSQRDAKVQQGSIWLFKPGEYLDVEDGYTSLVRSCSSYEDEMICLTALEPQENRGNLQVQCRIPMREIKNA